MFRAASVFLCVFAVAFASCKKDAAKSSGSDKGQGEVQAQTPTADPSGLKRPSMTRAGMAPITVDEVKPLLPTPAGARVLTEVAKAPQGERVQATYCFDKGTTTDVANTIKTDLEAAGWERVFVRTLPNRPDDSVIAGLKRPYRLTARVQKGSSPDCKGDAGQIHVSATVHKFDPAMMQRGAAAGGMLPNAASMRAGRMPRTGAAPAAPAPAAPATSEAGTTSPASGP